MEEPEIIKMLKYILLVLALHHVASHPLVVEQHAMMAPATSLRNTNQESDVVPAVLPGVTELHSRNNKRQTPLDPPPPSESVMAAQMRMSPVADIRDVHENLEMEISGGQKHIREVPRNPHEAPPPSDDLGALCSIFQFFLEPRRYSRCRVSNTGSDHERSDELVVPSPPRGQLHPEEMYPINPEFHRTVSNEVSSDHSGSDSYQSESANREVERVPQRQILEPLPPNAELDHNRRDNREPDPASKRYDQLEEFQIHEHPGTVENHHLIPPGPPPMFPKSSLDRTTIIVPERPCPRGERRDHKGYCRRIVRIRPSYQYGPPPAPYGHGTSRPIRYYYSRFVSVPTLQFFIPSVP